MFGRDWVVFLLTALSWMFSLVKLLVMKISLRIPKQPIFHALWSVLEMGQWTAWKKTPNFSSRVGVSDRAELWRGRFQGVVLFTSAREKAEDANWGVITLYPGNPSDITTRRPKPAWCVRLNSHNPQGEAFILNSWWKWRGILRHPGIWTFHRFWSFITACTGGNGIEGVLRVERRGWTDEHWVY